MPGTSATWHLRGRYGACCPFSCPTGCAGTSATASHHPVELLPFQSFRGLAWGTSGHGVYHQGADCCHFVWGGMLNINDMASREVPGCHFSLQVYLGHQRHGVCRELRSLLPFQFTQGYAGHQRHQEVQHCCRLDFTGMPWVVSSIESASGRYQTFLYRALLEHQRHGVYRSKEVPGATAAFGLQGYWNVSDSGVCASRVQTAAVFSLLLERSGRQRPPSEETAALRIFWAAGAKPGHAATRRHLRAGTDYPRRSTGACWT
jgi:hypothetical protein